jgi:hypothetical protein
MTRDCQRGLVRRSVLLALLGYVLISSLAIDLPPECCTEPELNCCCPPFDEFGRRIRISYCTGCGTQNQYRECTYY